MDTSGEGKGLKNSSLQIMHLEDGAVVFDREIVGAVVEPTDDGGRRIDGRPNRPALLNLRDLLESGVGEPEIGVGVVGVGTGGLHGLCAEIDHVVGIILDVLYQELAVGELEPGDLKPAGQFCSFDEHAIFWEELHDPIVFPILFERPEHVVRVKNGGTDRRKDGSSCGGSLNSNRSVFDGIPGKSS